MNALWNAACLLLCVVVNIDASDGPPPCLEDRKYAIDVITHQGFCEVCPKCDGGGFFKNTQVERRWDAVHGYTSCWPCDPCPNGHYREAGTQNVCLMCNKNCTQVNRYQSRKCGGSSPGHCGECFSGYEAEDETDESFCEETRPVLHQKMTQRTTQQTTQSVPLITTPSAVKTTSKPQLEDLVVAVSSESNEHLNHAFGVGEIVIIATVVLAVIVVVCAVAYLKGNCGGNNSGLASPEAYTSASSDRPFLSSPNCKYIYEKEALETDGPIPDVRQELTTALLSSHTGPQAIVPPHLCPMCLQDVELHFDETLTKDIFSLLSRRISGEHKRQSFFRALNLKEYEYEIDQELWQKDNQSHENFIYNVLNGWIKKKGVSNAKVLHDALCKAGFKDLSNDLISFCAANIQVQICSHNNMSSERAGVHQTLQKQMV